MIDKNKPNIGLWELSLKEISTLARCVDGKFLIYLMHGVAMSRKDLSAKLVTDFCQCLVDTGICNNEIAAEVYQQIVSDAQEHHKRLADAATQIYKGRVQTGREEPTTGSESESRKEGLRDNDGTAPGDVQLPETCTRHERLRER